ncbi:Hypp2436 [Branchiostoma lanceolatum]|uniref:Hypp2436 protein n=1 Tax=Branchiostoma lanceolatum TaxID=7740 RepID=A0A8K0ESF1_BRALA|nr:Hypp2436 [Branchiostoma lanceolatum]
MAEVQAAGGRVMVVSFGSQTGAQRWLQDTSCAYAEVQAAGGRVMVVSFGTQTGAQRWLQDTSCPYDMLLDQDRKLYGAFGLGRSVFKVWSVAALTYYAEQKAAGRTLPKKYENVEDDPHQMGGDFILDPQGRALLVHCSKVSTDRPEVSTIISVLKDYQLREEPTSKMPKEEEST